MRLTCVMHEVANASEIVDGFGNGFPSTIGMPYVLDVKDAGENLE